jgi:hypothetical protein
MLQALPCLARPEAARETAYSPYVDRADVQPAVRSSGTPFSKVVATLPPSGYRGRRACIDVGWETVFAGAVLVEGPVVPVDSSAVAAVVVVVQ